MNPEQSASGIPTSDCIRCGICCKKGGPSFHHEDRMLIDKGIILSKYLYTIRKGELAYDNVKGCLLPTDSDIIKIKGRKGSWACVFFDENKNSCRIYENRPLECRVLNCRDTREIERIYAEKRLTRKDLMGNIKGLWDLIEAHQSQCNYGKIRHLMKDSEDKKNDASESLPEMLRYDRQIRLLLTEKSGIDPEMTDFLFGRPLTETIRAFGVRDS